MNIKIIEKLHVWSIQKKNTAIFLHQPRVITSWCRIEWAQSANDLTKHSFCCASHKRTCAHTILSILWTQSSHRWFDACVYWCMCVCVQYFDCIFFISICRTSSSYSVWKDISKRLVEVVPNWELLWVSECVHQMKEEKNALF